MIVAAALSHSDYFVVAVLIGLAAATVLYVLVGYPTIRRRFHVGRIVEFTGDDGRVQRGTISTPPKFGTGIWGSGTLRIRCGGDEQDVRFNKVKVAKDSPQTQRDSQERSEGEVWAGPATSRPDQSDRGSDEPEQDARSV